ncbi:MAG TPA: serine/threonine-protein kinase [Thermoleophilaceae bacterium]|nr:serine/threonine-protein kinase [Thermoleophilaceae bacterium]
MSAPDQPKEGDTIGPFRVERMLGEGGMGRVYYATGPDGGAVALKLVKADLATDDVFRKRFVREADIAQRVDHPNVVPIVERGEHEGIPFLAQRYIGGGSLDDRIQREKELPLVDAIRMCVEVAGGLDALHEGGLVHRDVKPGNILLAEDGTAFITDFGLAKDHDRDASALTKPGQALGSMDYMAPEQIRGGEVNAMTDVYALGCVMYECMTGAPPFADRQGMRILWAHLQDDPPDLREKRSDVPEDVAWAMSRALEKEPENRPPTATAYARMVQIAAGMTPSPGG